MSMSEPDRVQELESKLAFGERTIDELSQSVFELQSRIERLEAACREMAEQLRVLTEKLPDDASTDEKPPHY